METAQVIIPDIHLHHEGAEAICRQYPGTNAVFLGDYFDFWNDGPGMHRATARWLAWSVMQPGRKHLLGNHDPFYFTGVHTCAVPGNTKEKYEASRKYLTYDIYRRMLTHAWLLPNFLATHAGLAACRAHPVLSHDMFLERQGDEYKEACRTGMDHPWLRWGSRRDGVTEVGGPLWCDWDDFQPIPELHQIVGHTLREQPSFIQCGQHWNINMDGALQQVGMKEDGTPKYRCAYPGGHALLEGRILHVFDRHGTRIKRVELA